MNQKLVIIFLITIFITLGGASSVFGQMSSTNYRIDWDAITIGGQDGSSSTNYILRDSVGDSAIGESDSTSYQNRGGYRTGVYDEVADFEVFVQNKSSQVAATAASGATVTVSSLGSITTGDMIFVVQNEGASQASAMGKVISTGVNTATVDSWINSSGGTAVPAIDGTNDYVYILNANSIGLGTLSTSAVTTAAIGWEATVDADDGYQVYVYESGDFAGSGTLNDVADGTVSAGSSEYGGRSSDTSLATSTFDTQDSAFTSSFQEIGSRSEDSFSTRDFLTIKAAMATGQTSGGYSHTLYVIYVGEY